VIIKVQCEIETGQYICLKTPKDAQKPFYIAQVLSSNDTDQTFKINWYELAEASWPELAFKYQCALDLQS